MKNKKFGHLRVYLSIPSHGLKIERKLQIFTKQIKHRNYSQIFNHHHDFNIHQIQYP